MKAKRLTALALAALMAASTTSVALAAPGDVDKDQALNFYAGAVGDDLYMMDEDGYIRAAVDGDFAPGDDIYLALKEYPSASSTELKRMNVYADWAVGKSWVDDVEIVYKKGQWKTDVAKNVTYTFTGLTSSLSKFNGQTFTTNSTESEAIRKAAVAALKDLINKDSDMSGYTKVNTQGSAYVIGNTFYDSKTNALNAMNLKEVSEYYEYNNNGEKKTEISKLTSVAANSSSDYIVTDASGAKYMTKAELDDAIAALGFKPIQDEIGDTGKEVWAKGSGTLGASGELNIALEAEKGDYTEKVSTYDNIYVAGRKTLDVYTHYDYIDYTKLTDPGVASKLGYTSIAQASDDGNYHELANRANYAITAESMKKSETAYFEGDNFKTTEFDSLGIKAASTVADNMYVESTSPNGKTMVNKDTVQSDRLAEAEKITASNYNAASTFSGNPTGSYDGYTTDSGYAYWVKISTKESTGTKDIDLVGDISIGRTKTSAKGNEVTLGVTLTNQNNQNAGDYTDVDSDVYIEPGERAVVSFADDAGDVVVEFGDDAWFEFNARGQGKLNLAYNTKYNKDFAYDYDDANIDFINFEGEPTTNRTGTLYIYADEDSYIYEVTSKGAKKINGAYYDDDEEAWVIRTRNLTSYAISDKKLKTVDQMNNGSSSSSSSKPGSNSGSGSNNGKPNPDTGR